MAKCKRKGYMIEIRLPEECGHAGYSVDCLYRYIKRKDKYELSMWLKRKDINDTFKIDSQEIDTQLISGTKGTIEDNIIRIVGQASLSNFFEPYIQRFEYTYKCFDRGNELFESERLHNAS